MKVAAGNLDHLVALESFDQVRFMRVAASVAHTQLALDILARAVHLTALCIVCRVCRMCHVVR
jgi:hypothetical protein